MNSSNLAGLQSLSLTLRRSAARMPHKTALIFEEQQWTFAEFDALVDELAQGLLDRSVSKGDRVAILARNSNAFLAIRYAVARIAAVFVPINVMLGEEDVAYILDHSGASISIMPVAVIEELIERMPHLRLWNTYGQTEMSPLATVLQPQEHVGRLGSAGRAALHVQTRIVDEGMNVVMPGEIGEIVHRSPHLLSGYWRQEEASAQAFTGGWFHTGDLGTMDAEGFLTVVDRKKDMIKSGGENISSREVEETIYAHGKVAEAAVVGLPHPVWIEAVTAFIVLKDGVTATQADILLHCKDRLSGFKLPKAVIFVPSLPKNASGKIVKRDIRDQYTASK
ncbi:MAG: AMP-binding protein [Sphingobium sp.]|nr:AMP-binding protein [Sphingobium sp.]MDX3910603.1 AMP-binding protein [Sphingobium sp.]